MFGCSCDSRSPMPASKDLTRFDKTTGIKVGRDKRKLPKLFMLQPISRIAMKSPDSNWSKMGTGHGQEFSSFSGFSPRTFLPAIDPSSLFREFPPAIFAFPHENSCEEFLAFLITLFRNGVGRNQQKMQRVSLICLSQQRSDRKCSNQDVRNPKRTCGYDVCGSVLFSSIDSIRYRTRI